MKRSPDCISGGGTIKHIFPHWNESTLHVNEL